MNKLASFLTAGQARLSSDDFRQLCDAGAFDGFEGRIELVNGDVERMPPPQLHHSMLQTQLILKLYELIKAQGLDWQVSGEVGIRIDPATVLGCDVSIFRPRAATEDWLDGPDLLLVAEVSVSTRKRDLEMKRIKYAAAGVPEYWVADYNDRSLLIFRAPQGGDYAERTLVPFGLPVSVPGLNSTIILD